jgi:hypothetical protein
VVSRCRTPPGRSRALANELGKRYVCAECATQVLVSKAGEGELACHGQPMAIDAPKALPSSD